MAVLSHKGYRLLNYRGCYRLLYSFRQEVMHQLSAVVLIKYLVWYRYRRFVCRRK